MFRRFIFSVQNTGHLLCFINLDFFIRCLHRDDERLHIQPAFMLSVLAMAKLMKSSALEDGAMGFQGAMILTLLMDDAGPSSCA
jgi:hypothetical protein